MENLKIIESREIEIERVKEVVKEAFYREDKDLLNNEWEFVDKVRSDEGYVEELSLVAMIDDEVVAYIIFTRAKVGASEGLVLGPLAVKPKYQALGVGKELSEYGLERAKALNYKWISVLGGDYYYQFGFEDALDYSLVIEEGLDENKYLKIMFLDHKRSVSGKIRYCDTFYDGDGNLL